MDAFLEKIVKRKQGPVDVAITVGLYFAAFVLMFLAMRLIDPSFGLIVAFGAFYGAWWVSGLRRLEFEYALTNGELDIDKIISQRRRKRIFSQNCKEFEVVARVDSAQFTPQVKSMENVIDASSSRAAKDLWFIQTRYNGKGTIIYAELTDAMVESMYTFIPRKVFRK